MSLKQTLSLCALLLITTSATASPSGKPQTIPGLGTTSFHTSTKSPEAQAAFLRGLLPLHAFEYDESAKAFRAAEKLYPSFFRSNG